MMDTSVLEYTAEDLVAHKLQREGILVAKPRFDQNGADLLALLQVRDGARFCRVQCKGRTLNPSSRAEVVVPLSYVTSGFVLFLFVEEERHEQTNLYCFFSHDMKSSWRQRNDSFVLSIKEETFRDELRAYEATPDRITALKHIIPTTNVDEEFSRVIYGSLRAVEEGGDTASFVGSVGPAPSS